MDAIKWYFLDPIKFLLGEVCILSGFTPQISLKTEMWLQDSGAGHRQPLSLRCPPPPGSGLRFPSTIHFLKWLEVNPNQIQFEQRGKDYRFQDEVKFICQEKKKKNTTQNGTGFLLSAPIWKTTSSKEKPEMRKPKTDMKRNSLYTHPQLQSQNQMQDTTQASQ